MQIVKAQRKGTPALIALWGPSGSGKTYSAIRVARGLVGPAGKIGLIDTENRRAEFYADLAGGWDHLDLQPPFGPDRYTSAFQEFEKAGGYGCVIVDSMSHVWEGEGGVLDIANRNSSPGLIKWNAPKMAYKRMLNNLLRAPFHVIFCVRAKDGVRQVGKGKDATIESVGLEPIAEKNFIYEMTAAFLLGPDHKPLINPTERFRCSPSVPAVKLPEALRLAVKTGEFLSEDTGKAVADWVAGGAAVDRVSAGLQRAARDAATGGTDALKAHWEALSKAERAVLKPFMDEFKSIAAAADAERASGEHPPVDTDDPFSDRFTDSGAIGRAA